MKTIWKNARQNSAWANVSQRTTGLIQRSAWANVSQRMMDSIQRSVWANVSQQMMRLIQRSAWANANTKIIQINALSHSALENEVFRKSGDLLSAWVSVRIMLPLKSVALRSAWVSAFMKRS